MNTLNLERLFEVMSFSGLTLILSLHFSTVIMLSVSFLIILSADQCLAERKERKGKEKEILQQIMLGDTISSSLLPSFFNGTCQQV